MGIRGSVYLLNAEHCSLAIQDEDFPMPDEQDSERYLDLDKAFYEINYLITGNAEWGFLTGGTTLRDGDELVEVHSPDAVRELAIRIQDHSADEIFAGCLLGGKQPDPEIIQGFPNNTEYVMHYLTRFIALLERAVQSKYGFLVMVA